MCRCGRAINCRGLSLYVLAGRGVLASPFKDFNTLCLAGKHAFMPGLSMACTGQIHRRYVEEMEAAEAADGRGWDVLFYGDSIMEEWR